MSAEPDTQGPRVIEVTVADDADSWTTGGFTVNNDRIALGSVIVRLTGTTSAIRGITGWTVSGLAVTDGTLDGLATCQGDPAAAVDPAAAQAPAHPNGVTGIDHLVVATPDLERTIEAMAEAGLDLRRIRDTTSYGAPMRQAFFRLGPTVLEVVSGAKGSGTSAIEDPATWFGLALNVDDLDETADLLGDALGTIKVAVQDGRRIATFRHKALGMSVSVAAMDDHADR